MCLSRLGEIQKQFATLVGTDNTEFMSSICRSSLAEESLHPIESVTTQLEAIIEPAKGLLEVLLQVDGVGEYWRQGQSICAQFRCVITHLEDILCAALEGFPVLHQAYHSKSLQYQVELAG